ncbi:hypothetical protein TEA_016783 [Camellia sinensis var. sinensis]|uniref:Terpene synthase N-terminal domain-containing protein n=1 Tax=Camellia sinensis var. sinensis TaxID=542762 RepID=A0A4S4E020_CAMSN|nr:hypothetical protein TEA_016783 [Camellia sinensis var. sinensis]
MAATTATTTISTTHKWSISVAEDLKCLTPHCTFTVKFFLLFSFFFGYSTCDLSNEGRALVWTREKVSTCGSTTDSNSLIQAIDLIIPCDEILAKQEQQLEEVRTVLRNVEGGEEEDSLKGLVMIDALQRLGIDYHFREDIEAVLHSQYMNSSSHSFTDQHDDLYEVSTRFRLLRQQGYNVPTDVFHKFKDKDGRFKTELSEDIRGLMGLYEASQLSIEGEDILDQAADFSAQQLNGCYMKLCLKVLLDNTNEVAYGVHKKYGWDPIDSLRRTWAILCNAFLEEAKWFASGQLPKAEEYLKNGIVSSGVPAVLVHMFFLLGHGMNKESVNFMIDNPDIITSTATILRLRDDLGSAKDENQDGHDGSYVDCYMKEHEGYTAETARKQVVDMISDAWKRLNRECLSPNRFSANFTQGCLNTARMVPLMYCYDDNHNLPILEEHMKSMFHDSVSL